MAPNIEKFRFGKITIDGKSYTRDVIILPDRVIPDWWREQGHQLIYEDLASIPLNKIDTLIIGCGTLNRMKVTDKLIQELKNKNLNVICLPTQQAVEQYQHRKDKESVCAALHLTC